ncbi:TIGR01777 family oxidoreductase [Stackebrandtia soli]|uniref:TIGR01777 family oxidoreductase n=1 Tax=Stackebrandtia soli TaxID=1892856 RepID=UPI0039E8564D
MRIVAAGVSGFIGSHLTARLLSEGHQVTRLVRRAPAGPDEVRWDPYDGPLDPRVLDGADAAINLCGAGIADKRWTESYKKLLQDSRVIPTRVLAEAVAKAGTPVLLNGSAVGVYGDTGGEPVDETAPRATDFLGQLARQWEDATEAASAARVVILRTAHVLSSDAVMVKRLLPVFQFGLGGRFGDGRQYFPWISLLDWIGAARFLLDAPISGPVNLAGPTPVTNAEFTRLLGNLLKRPTPWVIPGFALKIVAGEAAVELLRGAPVTPKVLLENDFTFEHQSVGDALRWSLGSR